MRVLDFSIISNPAIINFYDVSLSLAYGSDDLLTISAQPSGFFAGSCNNSKGERFCDVTQLNSGVSLR